MAHINQAINDFRRSSLVCASENVQGTEEKLTAIQTMFVVADEFLFIPSIHTDCKWIDCGYSFMKFKAIIKYTIQLYGLLVLVHISLFFGALTILAV